MTKCCQQKDQKQVRDFFLQTTCQQSSTFRTIMQQTVIKMCYTVLVRIRVLGLVFVPGSQFCD